MFCMWERVNKLPTGYLKFLLHNVNYISYGQQKLNAVMPNRSYIDACAADDF